MWIFSLTHRKMTLNGGGHEVEAGVTDGHRYWTIDEAGKLIITGEAVFLYQNERLADLRLLPRLTDCETQG